MTKITKKDVLEFLKEGGRFIGGLAGRTYIESLSQVEEQAFFEAIEIGIEKTIATLYDANVEDVEILRVVNTQWGIDEKEVESRLIREKQQALIRSLERYLKLQGYTKGEIDSFFREYKATTQIRHEKDLWKLKDNPEKLMKIIKKK